jgi:hypothetical protein
MDTRGNTKTAHNNKEYFVINKDGITVEYNQTQHQGLDFTLDLRITNNTAAPVEINQSNFYYTYKRYSNSENDIRVQCISPEDRNRAFEQRMRQEESNARIRNRVNTATETTGEAIKMTGEAAMCCLGPIAISAEHDPYKREELEKNYEYIMQDDDYHSPREEIDYSTIQPDPDNSKIMATSEDLPTITLRPGQTIQGFVKLPLTDTVKSDLGEDKQVTFYLPIGGEKIIIPLIFSPVTENPYTMRKPDQFDSAINHQAGTEPSSTETSRDKGKN